MASTSKRNPRKYRFLYFERCSSTLIVTGIVDDKTRIYACEFVCMYVCMYLLIGKGQIAQKRPYWGEDRIKRKIYE